MKDDENSQFSFWFFTFRYNCPKIFFVFSSSTQEGANDFHEKNP